MGRTRSDRQCARWQRLSNVSEERTGLLEDMYFSFGKKVFISLDWGYVPSGTGFRRLLRIFFFHPSLYTLFLIPSLQKSYLPPPLDFIILFGYLCRIILPTPQTGLGKHRYKFKSNFKHESIFIGAPMNETKQCSLS